MTRGKKVLDSLKYVKSAMKNFDQSEASIVVMWLPKEASDWSKFVERAPEVGFLQIFFWNNAQIQIWPTVKLS